MSNLSDYLAEQGVDPAQLVQQSKALETLQNEDRERRTARSAARRAKKSYDEANAPKPDRYGRGVSMRTVTNAVEGRPITRKNRVKIVRALNALLSQKQSDPVEVTRLFGDAPKKKVKK